MAGIESLGGFLAMFALNLADFPTHAGRLTADPALIPEAIEESLRYNTSAQRFRRRLTADIEMHGQIMRTGDYVCLAYGSANRDERRFPDPDMLRHPAQTARSPRVRRRSPRLPRRHGGADGGAHPVRGVAAKDPGVHACRERARLDAIDDVPQPDEPPSRPEGDPDFRTEVTHGHRRRRTLHDCSGEVAGCDAAAATRRCGDIPRSRTDGCR